MQEAQPPLPPPPIPPLLKLDISIIINLVYWFLCCRYIGKLLFVCVFVGGRYEWVEKGRFAKKKLIRFFFFAVNLRRTIMYVWGLNGTLMKRQK